MGNTHILRSRGLLIRGQHNKQIGKPSEESQWEIKGKVRMCVLLFWLYLFRYVFILFIYLFIVLIFFLYFFLSFFFSVFLSFFLCFFDCLFIIRVFLKPGCYVGRCFDIVKGMGKSSHQLENVNWTTDMMLAKYQANFNIFPLANDVSAR